MFNKKENIAEMYKSKKKKWVLKEAEKVLEMDCNEEKRILQFK